MSVATIGTAKRLARKFGATIHLANVQEYPGPVVDSGAAVVAAPITDLEKQRRSGQRLLLQLRKKHKLTGTCRSEFANGAFDMLCRIAAEIPADLIVTSTHGRTGLKRLLLGSTAERLVQYSPCLVFVFGSKKSTGNTQRDIKKILVPVDFSDCSLAGLTYAARFAKTVCARISVVHVVDLGPVMMTTGCGNYISPTYIEAARHRCADQLQAFLTGVDFDGVPFDTCAVAGYSPDGIYQTAAREAADLIIMSTHGRTGLRHVLVGSAAERTVRCATCSVLVVPLFSRVRKSTVQQKRPPAGRARADKSHSHRRLRS
ncbi:MAG TPA: universal stress protein [Candidatus Udaeobacter sp.]|nr:universal stress protein [Candidatus Udaeobacter sp.]